MSFRKLPPLYPLRAFEAAARQSSFTLAADELSITQSAVSHQVRKLEEYFGVRLFARAHGSVTLTAEGKRLQAACEQAFAGLAQISHDLPNSQMRETITLASPPLVFSWWLLPRLSAFRKSHPNIRFRFIHGVERRRVVSGDVDVALHWGKAVPEGFVGDKLMDVTHGPVASPRVASQLSPEPDAQALASLTLLHEVDYGGWANWMTQAGHRDFAQADGLIFDDPGMLVEAAVHGAGIALGPFPLIDELIESGRLTSVSATRVPTTKAYFLAIARNRMNKPGVRLFRNWFTAFGLNLQQHEKPDTFSASNRSYLG